MKIVGAVIGLAALTFGALKLVEHDPGPTADRSISTARLDDLCENLGQVSFPDAPAYEGPAPHPIVVVGFNDGSATPDAKVPAAWKPQRSQIQLIGCIGTVSPGNPAPGRTCTFNIPTYRQLPIVETTTSVRLYEARTGRMVADVAVESSNTPCPLQLTTAGDNPTVQGTPNYEQYEATFAPYVNR